MLTSLIWHSLIKALGLFFLLLILAFIFNYQKHFKSAKNIFYFAAILLVIQLSNVVFKIPNWTAAKQTFSHFILMLCSVYPLLLLSGWFPRKTHGDRIKVLLLLVTSLLIIYLFFLIFSRLVNI